MKKNIEKKEPVITHYDIEDGKIIMHYEGMYTDFSIPYTKENELEVLKSMRDRIKYMIKNEDKYKETFKSDIVLFILNTIIFLINLYCLGVSFGDNKTATVLRSISTILFGTISALYGVDAIKNQDKIEDIKKYKYYLENEKLLNDEIFKRFVDLYGETSTIDELNEFTVNDLHDYSLQDLEEMVESIKGSKELKYEYKKEA